MMRPICSLLILKNSMWTYIYSIQSKFRGNLDQILTDLQSIADQIFELKKDIEPIGKLVKW